MEKIERVWKLCVDKRYFTCGGNSSYDKMFDLIRNGSSNSEIALAIWLCSDNAKRTEIEKELNAIDDEISVKFEKAVMERIQHVSGVLYSVIDENDTRLYLGTLEHCKHFIKTGETI